MDFSKTVETSSKSIPCFCRLIAFFSSSHVNFIGNTVYTFRIYVKRCSNILHHLPNGHLEFRRVSDVNSEVWFAQLFVVRPQSDDFNRLDVFQNLIHQSMLYVDATRTCASQISD